MMMLGFCLGFAGGAVITIALIEVKNPIVKMICICLGVFLVGATSIFGLTS